MGKIFFGKNAQDGEKDREQREPVQPEEERAEGETAAASDYLEEDDFDKDKLFRYFRRHPKNKIKTNVERYSPSVDEGLTSAQVQTRFSQFLFNDTNKKYSKSYASIFVGNI